MGRSEVSLGIEGRHPPVVNSCLAGSPGSDSAHTVQNGTVLRLVLPYCIKMRKSDLTEKQWFSVPCPTCGVAPGEPCLLHSGGLRTEPHLDRKLSAAEAIETIHQSALDDYAPALAHHWAKASAPVTDITRAVEYAR